MGKRKRSSLWSAMECPAMKNTTIHTTGLLKWRTQEHSSDSSMHVPMKCVGLPSSISTYSYHGDTPKVAATPFMMFSLK